MIPPWILIITTLVTSSTNTATVSFKMETVRIANEVTCRTMETDFTYDRLINAMRITSRARCYLDAPDVAIPGRP